ncbi:MAG TPA: hypothetical protein DCQ79_06750 [Rhizobiales bacterium]|nr:hypothetical protein [Hyphomicrobiales bacterium]
MTGRSSNSGPLIGKPGQQANKDQGVLDARLRGHDTEKAIPARPRDYYRIEDEDGRRYWVFREGLYQESEHGLPSWFLHGVFG